MAATQRRRGEMLEKITVFTSVTARIDPMVIENIPGNHDKFFDTLRKLSNMDVSAYSEDNIYIVQGKWEAVDQIRNYVLELLLCQQTVQRAAEAVISSQWPGKKKHASQHDTESPLCTGESRDSGRPASLEVGSEVSRPNCTDEEREKRSTPNGNDEILVSTGTGVPVMQDFQIDISTGRQYPHTMPHCMSGVSNSRDDEDRTDMTDPAGPVCKKQRSVENSALNQVEDAPTEHSDETNGETMIPECCQNNMETVGAVNERVKSDVTPACSGSAGAVVSGQCSSTKFASKETYTCTCTCTDSENQGKTSQESGENNEILNPWPVHLRPKKLQPMQLAIDSLRARAAIRSEALDRSGVDSPSSGLRLASNYNNRSELQPHGIGCTHLSPEMRRKVSNSSKGKFPIKYSELFDLAKRVRDASEKRSMRRKYHLMPASRASRTDSVETASTLSSSHRSLASPEMKGCTSESDKNDQVTCEIRRASVGETFDKNTRSESKDEPPYSTLESLPGSEIPPQRRHEKLSFQGNPLPLASGVKADDSRSWSEWPNFSASNDSLPCLPGKKSSNSENNSGNTRNSFVCQQAWPDWNVDPSAFPQLAADKNQLINLGKFTSSHFTERSDQNSVYASLISSGRASSSSSYFHDLAKHLDGSSAACSKHFGQYRTDSPSTWDDASFSDNINQINTDSLLLNDTIDASEDDIGSPFKCALCLFETHDRSIIKAHRRRCHIDGKHKCVICSEMFNIPKDLLVHMQNHDKTRAKSCPVDDSALVSEHDIERKDTDGTFLPDHCDESFSSNGNLQDHGKVSHQLTSCSGFMCQECGKTFSQKHSLMEHRNIHLGVRPFQCKVCDKNFTFKTSLRQHMMLHNGNKNYFCDVCDKGFVQKNSLRIHSAIHENKRSHVCSYCGKGFTQKQAMQRHERIHSGERPYACQVCGKRFNDSSILRRHMNVHQREGGQGDSAIQKD